MKKLKEKIKSAITLSLENLFYPHKDYSLAPPKNNSYGDLSSNIALLLSKDLKKAPMDIGKIIVAQLNKNLDENISSISLTNPGFINFVINNEFYHSQILNIINDDTEYGKGNQGNGQTANVEFVSANPTGPLTIGHGRNAILGDTISNILEWQGYKVTREYYFNDAGRQMRILAQSVNARYFELLGKKLKLPKDGYQGEYIKNIAQSILKEKGKELSSKSSFFKEQSESILFKEIKNCLIKLGIKFDYFTNEKTFYENGDIKKLITKLRKKKLIYEKDNATWFKTSALGKNQDRVYIKATGEPTYRVPDTAYHIDKIKRKYDLIIDIFGADHADAYPDVITALQALGYKTNHIKVLIYQFVTLVKDGQKIKMSTRKANFITLDKLIDEVGVDVIRYFFIMRSMSSHLDFDINLAKDNSDKNPVFYLQYAHARICNIIHRFNSADKIIDATFDSSLLIHDDEINLLKYVTRFPEYVNMAYKNLEPQNIVTYLQELSTRFHKFYNSCRVMTDDIELSKARIALVKATKIVLINGFSILGISAPEKM
ncbi:MAG: arginine--tRNA ligase [Candidatus Neomarinimicrobiota bacterium]